MMRLKWFAALMIVLCLAGPVSLSAAPPPPSTGKTYVFGLWDMMGGKTTQYKDLIKKIALLLFDKMNEKIVIKDLAPGDVESAVAGHKVDFVALLQSQYIEMRLAGKKITPVLTAAPIGHVRSYKCLITGKAVNYAKLADLKGLRFAVTDNPADYFGARWYMEKNGMNTPFGTYFSKMIFPPDDGGVIAAVSDGIADAGITTGSGINFQKFANAAVLKKVKVSEANCFELPWPDAPVVWVGVPDPTSLAKLYDVMGRLDEFPEFRQMKPLLTSLKLKLNFVSARDYDELAAMYTAGKKKGWMKEYKQLGGTR